VSFFLLQPKELRKPRLFAWRLGNVCVVLYEMMTDGAR
jgi:hypothetical protein